MREIRIRELTQKDIGKTLQLEGIGRNQTIKALVVQSKTGKIYLAYRREVGELDGIAVEFSSILQSSGGGYLTLGSRTLNDFAIPLEVYELVNPAYDFYNQQLESAKM